jgi:hypothetical protein
MRTARTKPVDDACTAFCAIERRAAGSRPGLVIDDEPPRPRHAFPTEALA